MSELGLFAFCAAMGFVSAATISSFYRWVTAQRVDFSVEGKTISGVVAALLLSVFAGPFIVVEKVIAGLRSHEIRALTAVVGFVVAGAWSVCAGIFYLSLLVTA